ncbi:MAG TPA: GxxExxY protein [Phycisphaerales bacterium]|nr:GxxExxY protein [Phycisphaerales bacterium]
MPNDYRDDGRNRGGRSGGRGGRGYGGQNDRNYNDRGSNGGGNGGERRGIPLSDLDPKITEASRKVIGCSIEVHKALGPGYPADIYLEALRLELDNIGLHYKPRQTFPVTYRGQKVGEVTCGLFVDGLFLVTVMAEPREVDTPDRLRLRAQLKAANLDLGLIINFADKRLTDGLVRVLNIEKINLDRGVTSQHDGEVDSDAGPSGQIHDFENQ